MGVLDRSAEIIITILITFSDIDEQQNILPAQPVLWQM